MPYAAQAMPLGSLLTYPAWTRQRDRCRAPKMLSDNAHCAKRPGNQLGNGLGFRL